MLELLVTACGVLGFFFAITSFICWINVITPAFHQSRLLGVITFVAFPIAFLWGWMKAKEHNLKAVMLVWTVCLVPAGVFAMFVPKISEYLGSLS